MQVQVAAAEFKWGQMCAEKDNEPGSGWEKAAGGSLGLRGELEAT